MDSKKEHEGSSEETTTNYEAMELFGWALSRSKFKKWIEPDAAAPESSEERTKIYLNIVGSLDMLGLGNIHEPEALFVEPLNCFTLEDRSRLIQDLSGGIDPTLLSDAKLDIIDTELIRQYTLVQATELGGGSSGAMQTQLLMEKPGNTASLFDPLYGMAIVKKDNKWRNVCFSSWLWKSRAMKMPDHLALDYLKKAQDSLSEGVILAKLAFSAIFSEEAKKSLRSYLVPEIVVNSPDELSLLIDRMNQEVSAKTPKLKIWFRGQASDFLVPDRIELARQNVTPYSSVRDSSLVPTLFRNIDNYTSTPQQFAKLVRHIGDWATNAKLLLPSSYTILDITGTTPYIPKPIPQKATSRVTFFMAGKPHMDVPSLKDLGPYTMTEILDENKNLIDCYIKLHNPSLQGYREMLLLQHYGCQTPYLDITHDSQIALWFALHKLIPVSEGKLKAQRIDKTVGLPNDWPTIYVFLLDPHSHPVIDTSDILSSSQFLRPKVQKCGLLGGAGTLSRNYAARFIATKIRLGPEFTKINLPQTSDVFPNAVEDLGLKQLLEKESHPYNDRLFKVYNVIDYISRGG